MNTISVCNSKNTATNKVPIEVNININNHANKQVNNPETLKNYYQNKTTSKKSDVGSKTKNALSRTHTKAHINEEKTEKRQISESSLTDANNRLKIRKQKGGGIKA